MKKLLILAVLWKITSAFASVSGNIIVLGSNVSYDTAGVQVDITGTSFGGNYKIYVAIKNSADTVWVDGDSLTTTGTGIKPLVVKYLVSNKTYNQVIAVLKKPGFPNDTLFSSTTFTTKPAPPVPNVSFTTIVGSVTKFIITVTNATGYYPTIYTSYGDALQYTAPTITGHTGSFKDTLYLVTPLPNTFYAWYVRYDIPANVPLRDTFFVGGFTTPAIAAGDIVSAVVTATKDSITITDSVVIGTSPGKLQFILRDSVGSIKDSTTLWVTVSGKYSHVTDSLPADNRYYWFTKWSNSLGSDSTSGTIRTLSVPRTAAPTVSLTSPTVACGEISFAINASPSAGDTASIYVVRGTDGVTFPDTVFERTGVTAVLATGILHFIAPIANQVYYYKPIGVSKDGLKSEGFVVNATTPPAMNLPNVLFSVDGLSTRTYPLFSFSGNGFCGFSIVSVTIRDASNNVVWDTVVLGGAEQFNGSFNLPNLPNGTYTFEAYAENSLGQGAPLTKTYERNLATAVVQHTKPAEITPETPVSIRNMAGQTIFVGPYGYFVADATGVYLFTAKKQKETLIWKEHKIK